MKRGSRPAETTPLGDRLRVLAVAHTADGNMERGRGLAQAADLVDEQAHLLSGRAFVDALDRMIAVRMREATAELVADVVAALRDEAPGARPAKAERPPRPRRADAARAPGERSPSVHLPRPVGAPPVRRLPTSGELGRGERRTLVAIAQHSPGGVSHAQLQALTGFKARTRQDYVQRLSSRGLVARGGRGLVATFEGERALGTYEKLPTGRALLAHWLGELGEGESTILQFVASFYPHAVSGARIEERTGYAPRTRQDYVQRLIARHLIEKVGTAGNVQACDHLFDALPRASEGAAGASP